MKWPCSYTPGLNSLAFTSLLPFVLCKEQTLTSVIELLQQLFQNVLRASEWSSLTLLCHSAAWGATYAWMLKIDSHSKTNTHLRRGLKAYVRDVRVRLNTLFSHLQCIQPIHHNLSMDNEVKRPDATRWLGIQNFYIDIPNRSVAWLWFLTSMWICLSVAHRYGSMCADSLCHRAPSVSQHTCTLRLSRIPLSGVMLLPVVASHWSRVTPGDGFFQC